jgi:hypothetical protein
MFKAEKIAETLLQKNRRQKNEIVKYTIKEKQKIITMLWDMLLLSEPV